MWNKLNPSEALCEQIMIGLERWKQSAQWTRDGGQFIPNPATFLNGERWKDECVSDRASAAGQGVQVKLGTWQGENLQGKDYDFGEIARIAAEKLKGGN